MKIALTRAKAILAAGVVAAAFGGLGLAGAQTASAATPSCGPGCIDIFSKNFGSFTNPSFVLDSYKQGDAPGTPVILFRTSNADPAEDFTISDQGSVSDFLQAGLVSSALALHYGCDFSLPTNTCGSSAPDDFALEIEYAPFGADTGLCAGVSGTATANEKVTLQSCGVSSDTTWIADTVDSCPSNPLYFGEIPLINGSDTNFSQPFVMTYPGTGYPTDNPRPQLYVSNLTGFSQSGGPGQCGTGSISGPSSNQLWAAVAGVLK
jgi:hypothetical protein